MAYYSSPSELEKLVSDCEFENQQYMKLIEQEDQLIEALNKEIEFKVGKTKRLQEAVSQLDVDTKQCHKQYTQNRDNLDSLKKTNDVLTEHVAAMNSKLENLELKTQAERQEHDCHLQRYRDIMETYQCTYESWPLAKELKKQKELEADIKQENQEKEKEILEAKQKIKKLEEKNEVSRMGRNEFIVTVAKMRVQTQEIKQEIERKEAELTQLKQMKQGNENAASDKTAKANVQQLTDMQLVDKEQESVEKYEQQKQLETQSPMISMLGNREDETEPMQIDVVSPDQINLQFLEEQVTTHHTETPDKQTAESYDISGKEDTAVKTKVEGIGHLQQRSHSLGNVAQHTGVLEQDVQLPFVSYKARGPEGVDIHLDKSASLVKQQRQQQQQHLQLQSVIHSQSVQKPNQMTSQRQTSMSGYERANSRPQFAGYRPHIPHLQVGSFTPMTSTALDRKPSIVQTSPAISRPGGGMAQGSPLTRPQGQHHISRHFQTVPTPSVQQPRHTGGPSRLPVLQSPRTPTVQLQKQQQDPLPGASQTPKLAQTANSTRVASSPLHLTTMPIRRHSPLQLPSKYQLQQKASPQTSLPSFW